MKSHAPFTRHSRLLPVAVVLLAAQSPAHAVPVATWQVDRLSGFRLEISGTFHGDDTWAQSEGGEFTSPSGRWHVEYSGTGYYWDSNAGEFSGEGHITTGHFTGFHSFTFNTPGGYGDYGGGPGHSSEDWFEFHGSNGADLELFGGYSRVDIFDGDPADPNTWNYLVTITLDTPAEFVPDSGYTCLLLAMTLGVLALAMHRLGKKAHQLQVTPAD